MRLRDRVIRRGRKVIRTSSRSLKKSAFWRLLVITLLAVLIFYGIGLTVNEIGIRNVRNDMQAALEAHAEYAADQIDREFDRLKFFMLEMLSDKQLLRFAFSYPILSEWERLSCIKALSAQEYMIKRASDLVDSVQIMFPGFGKTIVTEQAVYADLDRTAWDFLYPQAERGRVTTVDREGCRWMLLPRMDGNTPLFLIAFSVPQEKLAARLEMLGKDQTKEVILTREDGYAVAAWGEDPKDGEKMQEGRNGLTAEAALASSGLILREYAPIDEAIAPFAVHRAMLWLLTGLALVLMGAYLWYYNRYILRPLTDLSESMRQVEQDGQYRMNADGNTDYTDLYSQFNHMVDHLEQLTGQVYEERYRAKRAELKQLQMQIDPHFLYNTLYLIYRMAQAEGNRDLANLTMHLSNYFRYITKMPEQVVRLRDEIAHVMNYLEIQRVRFEPRIRIEAEPLPEEIADEPIPSLIIQPIVENAFQHGVKDMDSGGLITLRYRIGKDTFDVIVSDNSGKMTPEKVEALWARMNDPGEQGSSALRNLYRRLQLYEGEEQVLRLECRDGGLTAAVTFQKAAGGRKRPPAVENERQNLV